MKEKISRNKISRHYKSFFELDNMALAENDNLMIDWGESLINELVNQEVERRIAERMPSKRDTEQARTNVLQQYLVGNISLYDVVCQTELFYCSRLTNPGVNDSQKTEGGIE